mgnify:CR=1 FL=1
MVFLRCVPSVSAVGLVDIPLKIRGGGRRRLGASVGSAETFLGLDADFT